MTMQNRRDDAIAWHVRLSGPSASDGDWSRFTEWLEADPANAEAYDQVALDDAGLSDLLAAAAVAVPAPQNDNEPGPARWYQRRGTMAVAASAVLAVLATPLILPMRNLETIETRAGETREIALNDGSRIALNGATRIRLDRRSDRFARLEAGEAVFDIRHDPANPFTLQTPDSTLRDIGTRFNVRQDRDGLEVSVAEGAVQYNPKDEAITVTAGQLLTLSRDHPTPVVSRADPGTMAGWQQGRLVYLDARLDRIAQDLTRSIGTTVNVSPDMAYRTFTGVIRIDHDDALLFHRLESLLGVRAKHNGAGWQLTS